MNINIGENIKNLRKKKDITQEQLSQFLNISNAAISKWERGETYPDISLLPILAKFFDVTIDELLGYDVSKIQDEISEIEKKYFELRSKGLFDDASVLIYNAHQKYYDDYIIMCLYMQDIVGGRIAKKSLLIEKKDELLRMCDNILRGCNTEKIRLEAISYKAKILYALGQKQQALDMLKSFPGFSGTVGIMSEQLFDEYDSVDSLKWVKKNLYSISGLFSVKLIKKIWFDEGGELEEKLLYAEKLGDDFFDAYEKSKEISVLIMTYKLWESLSIRLIAYWGKEDDIVRIKRKELSCAKMLDEIARDDYFLSDFISHMFNGKSILNWSLDFLDSAPQKTYARLRKSLKFNQLLDSFRVLS